MDRRDPGPASRGGGEAASPGNRRGGGVLDHPRGGIDTDHTGHFVTDGIEPALVQARAAAGDGDVAVVGGATTINQYLAAGLIGELRLHIAPLTLGAGTRLFEGVPPLKLEQAKSRAATSVTHVTYRVPS